MNKLLMVFATFIILTLVDLGCSSSINQQTNTQNKTKPEPIGEDFWTAEMGWRYVAYREGDSSISLSIEPMFRGPDRVYVPAESSWLQTAPAWARQRRREILSRLKSVKWNRKLEWPEASESSVLTTASNVISGSLESTVGGRALENMRLFHPSSKVTHEQAHEYWHEAARMFAEELEGRVRIFMRDVIPDSVFQAVELPALKKNLKVTLEFK